jgi:hypothetical protein
MEDVNISNPTKPSFFNFSKKKLILIHSITLILVLLTIYLLARWAISLKQESQILNRQIDTLQTSLELEKEKDNIQCTISVDTLDEIYPIDTCDISDITLKQIYINNESVKIRAVFTKLDNGSHKLNMYLNDKEIESNIFSDEENPSLDTRTLTGSKPIRLLTLKEKGVPKLLAVFGVLAAQNEPQAIVIFNTKGEILFSEESVTIYDTPITLSDTNSINNSFKISEQKDPFPTDCDDVDGGRILSENKSYEIVDGEIKLTGTQIVTYTDYCASL